MINRRRFNPYIRRARAGDRSESLRVAFQLAHYELDCYVLVQRGFRHLVMVTGKSRREIIDSLEGARNAALRRRGDWKKPKSRDFRTWSSQFGRKARKNPR